MLTIDLGTTWVKWGLAQNTRTVTKPGRAPSPLDLRDLWNLVQEVVHAFPGDELEGLVLTGRMAEAAVRFENGEEVWVHAPTRQIGSDDSLEAARWRALTGYGAEMALLRHWLRQIGREAAGAIRSVLPIKDWIVFQAGGDVGTDLSSAGALGLLDLSRRSWAETVMGSLGLTGEALPPLQPAYTDLGPARDFGSDYSHVRLYRGCGDGVAGTLGVGSPYDGLRVLNLGTHAVYRVLEPSPLELSPDYPSFAYPWDNQRVLTGYRLSGAGDRLSEEDAMAGTVRKIAAMVRAYPDRYSPVRPLYVTGGWAYSKELMAMLRVSLGLALVPVQEEATLIGAAKAAMGLSGVDSAG